MASQQIKLILFYNLKGGERRMYNSTTNEISFPHVIPGNILDDKVQTFNSINGGITRLANMNLIRNRFLGGTVEFLGLINEYGIYACPHYETKEIRAFYIPSAEILTSKGKEAISKKYPGVKFLGMTSGLIKKALTEEELKNKSELISKAVERGASAAQVSSNTISELDGLIRAMDSGKSKTVEVDDGKSTSEEVEKIEHVKAKPTQAKRKATQKK